MAEEFGLRDYQIESVQALRDGIRAGHRAQLLVAPTGAGKTVMAAYLLSEAARRNSRSAFIVDRVSLVDQTSATLDRYGVDHGVIQSGHWRRRMHAPVQVCSVQTLERRGFGADWQLVVVDEAHCMRQGMLQWIKRHNNVVLIGATATPFTPGLRDIYSNTVNVTTTNRLIAEGHLVPLRMYAAKAIDMTGAKVVAGEWAEREIERRGTEIVGDVVSEWVTQTQKHFGGPAKTLVFSATVAHGDELVRQFQAAGFNFIQISYKDGNDEDRRAIIEEFRKPNSSIVGLISCEALTKGFDVPDVLVGVACRPYRKSFSSHIQQCLDADTEVLTERGWLGPDSVTTADRVAAFDMAADAIKYVEVQRVTDRALASGESMYAIDGPHLNLRVTGGHDMVVRCRGKTAVNWVKEPAERSATRGSMFILPVAGVVEAPGAALTDDELRFIGWYLTDGTINKIHGQLAIGQSSAKTEHCAEIHRVLTACGFKFGDRLVKRTKKFAGYADSRVFTVSRGAPIGTNKHLRGYGALSQWLDRAIPSCYDGLDGRQLRVLLGAMNLGDGANQDRTITWTRRTMVIVFGDNRAMADRFQQLCVTRGLRCNQSVQRSPGKASLHYLHIAEKSVATVAGSGNKDGSVGNKKPYARSRFARTSSVDGERVWCVTNEIGTLVVRRRGKVAIVGNCGRVMRAAPGKTFGLWLDHCGNAIRFRDDQVALFENGVQALDEGALDSKTRKEPEEHEKAAMKCRACGFVLPDGARACPACGAERARRESTVEAVPGRMFELDGGPVADKTPAYLRDRTAVWMQLTGMALDRKKGDVEAAKKWANGQYKSLYGDWPAHRFDPDMGVPPSEQVRRKVMQGIIAWAKAREAERATA
jgi:late competence protein required for DNA uptake (superfamily II DNA/RNA helicase)